MSPRRDQRVHDGREFMRPMGAGCEHDGTGTRDGPLRRAGSKFAVLSGKPAMAEDVEMEARSIAQISFKGQRLSLFVPQA